VKNTGDGLMVVFRASAVDAVTCASKMHDRVEALDLGYPAFVRVGVSAGEAACESGDWFGTPVVEAARLCAKAEPGQTLVSELVRGLVGSRGGHQFRSVGALTLKGLSAPLPSAAVIRTPIAAPTPRPARLPRRWPLVVGGAVAIVLVGAGLAALVRSFGSERPVLAPVGYIPRLRPASCPTDFGTQVPNGTCGMLAVPEDRSRPGGRWLSLSVMRAPARTTSPSSDPTISIGTGPTSDDPATSPARDHSELISLSPRGQFQNDPAMACPEFEPVADLALTKPDRDPGVIAAGQPALRACHDRLVRSGVALARYTVQDSADDVLDLARALHLTRVNLVATGSGIEPTVPMALSVVREAPTLVRTLTLQNPWLPSLNSIDRTATLAAAFDHYVSICDANPQCAHAYPDLAGALRNGWAFYNAHPQVVDASVPGTGPGLGFHHLVLVNGASAGKALASVLGNPLAAPFLASAVAKPPLDLIAGFALMHESTHRHDFPWAAYLSSSCSYPFSLAPGRALTSATRPELAGVDDGFFDWACAAWTVPIAPDASARPASTVPALFVVAPLVADVPQQPAVIAGFPNASVLTLPTLGSEALRDGSPLCLNALRREFLRDPTRHLDTADCSKQSPPINFLTPP
jgi:hypothetical protein